MQSTSNLDCFHARDLRCSQCQRVLFETQYRTSLSDTTAATDDDDDDDDDDDTGAH